ncbi:MAG: hypothetical protein HN948_02425 [Clostridia bacterium]|nr:hypothetical protein [Clostridia bacterium]MBT7121846.1 hypothetical protein [Clostridia bacterium]
MKSNITELICPKCEATGSKEIQKRICIHEHMDFKQDIMSGAFFEWECPGCSERFFIKNPFLYNDSENRFMVYYIPDFEERSHKIPSLIKTKSEYDTDSSTLRIAADYVTFVEKIRILESGLDDRIVETVKLLYSKLTQQETNNLVYSMVFEGGGVNDDLRFAVFLKDNDFEAVIPYTLYEKTRDDFSHLFTDETAEQFIVVDQQWVLDMLS